MHGIKTLYGSFVQNPSTSATNNNSRGNPNHRTNNTEHLLLITGHLINWHHLTYRFTASAPNISSGSYRLASPPVQNLSQRASTCDRSLESVSMRS